MVADELEIKKAAADFDVTVTAAMFTTTTPPWVRVVPALGNRRRLKIVVL